MARSVLIAQNLSRVAYELRDASQEIRDLDDVVAVAANLSDVAGRLANVYDQLTHHLLVCDAPQRHAAGAFLRAADELRAAGAVCRYARGALADCEVCDDSA